MRIQTIPSDAVDVLIVEDDTHARQTLRLLLEQRGYRCAEARDGRQALALARDQPPRCVLLDLVIAGLDGFVVARRLRADLRTYGPHIHCLTGLQCQWIREQTQRAGIEGYLIKPVDGHSLLNIIGAEVKREEEVKAAVVSGLTKPQAEDVLDWLENYSCTGLAVKAEEDSIAVRCVCPPSFRLDQEEDGGLRLVRTGR